MIPRGPRKRRSDGKPLQAYRQDQLSQSYRRERAAAACDAESTAQARRDHARQIAARIVREHGYRLVVEDVSIRAWARQWGRRIAAFSPGLLVTALEREATAVAALAGIIGGVERASTRTTALSQHCLCGQRVAKTLAERTHAVARAACAAIAMPSQRRSPPASSSPTVATRRPPSST